MGRGTTTGGRNQPGRRGVLHSRRIAQSLSQFSTAFRPLGDWGRPACHRLRPGGVHTVCLPKLDTTTPRGAPEPTIYNRGTVEKQSKRKATDNVPMWGNLTEKRATEARSQKKYIGTCLKLARETTRRPKYGRFTLSWYNLSIEHLGDVLGPFRGVREPGQYIALI